MAILGCVVRVKAIDVPRLAMQLQGIAGVDLALNPGDGRMVLVIEDSAETTAAQTFAAISLLPEIHSSTLVYEYSGADAGSTEAEVDTRYQSWRTSMAELAADHPLTRSTV